ncbi:hypothetical protein GCM10027614_51320 [Micromonospora vulcania]
MYRTIRRTGIALALVLGLLTGAGSAAQAGTVNPHTRRRSAAGYAAVDQDPIRAYVRGGCAIWGGLLADPSGSVHRHDRANPAIGGIGTCL